MAVSTEHTKDILMGDGVNTKFPFTFQVIEKAQIHCLKVLASGEEIELLNTEFEIKLNDNGGGEVTYPLVGEPLAEGCKFIIYRKTEIKQDYWAEVPLDVEVLRASKLDTIKSVYESQRNYGVVEYQGMSFSIHETAKQNLTASVLLAQTLGGNIDYCEADGIPHSFTLEEFKPIIQVISETIKALEFKFYQLERQIKSATTIEELRAITWE